MELAQDPEAALDPVRLVVVDPMRVLAVVAAAAAGHNKVVLPLVVDPAQDMALLCLNRGRLMVMVGPQVLGGLVAVAVVVKL